MSTGEKDHGTMVAPPKVVLDSDKRNMYDGLLSFHTVMSNQMVMYQAMEKIMMKVNELEGLLREESNKPKPAPPVAPVAPVAPVRTGGLTNRDLDKIMNVIKAAGCGCEKEFNEIKQIIRSLPKPSPTPSSSPGGTGPNFGKRIPLPYGGKIYNENNEPEPKGKDMVTPSTTPNPSPAPSPRTPEPTPFRPKGEAPQMPLQQSYHDPQGYDSEPLYEGEMPR